MVKPNKPSVKTRNASVVAGIDKHITSSAMVGGVAHTPATLKAVFSDQNTAIDAADALHKQWQDQVQVMRVAGRNANATYLLLRSFLIGQYGNNANAVLNDFGMSAPKAKGPKTVKTKSAGVAKRAATRAARHTMGKNQKKQVKGTGAEPVVAPKPTDNAPASPSPVATVPASPQKSAS